MQAYGKHDSPDDRAVAAAAFSLQNQLRQLPVEQWKRVIADTAARSGVDMEIFARSDIAGEKDMLDELKRGRIAFMQAGDGESWVLEGLNENYVLAIKAVEQDSHRGLLEWALTLLFYAAIALVIMIWIWPLRAATCARSRTGRRASATGIGGSMRTSSRVHRIYPLAETFRKMAARIDGLIVSHKDMSNAVSHEIKTPLARMQFEIELAQHAQSTPEMSKSLANIKTDIAAINDLVTATLDYAILERADVSLNMGTHDFTALIPAITEYVKHDVRPDLQMSADVTADADRVNCDMHLLESVLKNLLYNASRYAKREVRVSFRLQGGENQLMVDDDGPGIPEPDRKRAFESFVQLDHTRGKKAGFGLGLAIVKRIIEWHGGEVVISQSPLGGARFCATWPIKA